MPSCCYDDEYGEMFTSREAARTASRFRRKGLRGTAAELAGAVQAVARTGSSLIEVGGGAGQIQVELLESGLVAKSLNIELSDSWEEAGLALIDEHGLNERVERRIGDFVDQAESLPRADVVILHRVICCYPDWRAMLTAAGSRAQGVIGMTIPAYRWSTRTVIRLTNLTLKLRGMRFRAFVHPTQPMIEMMKSAGFSVVYDQMRPIWRTIVFQRPTSAG
ncbi:MAG TPA: methyltransferase [Acidimicrobiia bacterium]|nr:methyltransferase [Acidimicrobiia bacterium]